MLRLLSLVALVAVATADAQNVTTLNWSLGAGPSAARPSGRRGRLPSAEVCFSCKKTDQLVTGADEGKLHAALRVSGKPSAIGLAFQMEGMFNHAISAPAVAVAPTCTRFGCEQKRTALVDDAWILGAGFELALLSDKRVSPYIAVTGGLSLNKLTWSQDSTNISDVSGHSIQFGPYVAAGAGVRVQVWKWVSAFVDCRYYTTLVTPGSSMTPLSIGVMLRTRISDNFEY